MKRLCVVGLGFAAGLLICVLANVMSYRQMLQGSVLTDAPVAFGFPFKLHASSGFGGEWILWSGLIADIVIAILVGAILGLVAGLILKKSIVD